MALENNQKRVAKTKTNSAAVATATSASTPAVGAPSTAAIAPSKTASASSTAAFSPSTAAAASSAAAVSPSKTSSASSTTASVSSTAAAAVPSSPTAVAPSKTAAASSTAAAASASSKAAGASSTAAVSSSKAAAASSATACASSTATGASSTAAVAPSKTAAAPAPNPDHDYNFSNYNNQGARNAQNVSHASTSVVCRKRPRKAATAAQQIIKDIEIEDDSSIDSDYNPEVDDPNGLDSGSIAEQCDVLEEEVVEAGPWMNNPPVESGLITDQQKLRMARCRTQAMRSSRDVLKHKLLPPCPESCRNKCTAKIDDIERENIRRYFWTKSFPERRLWMNGHISLLRVKQRKNKNHKERNTSLKYTLDSVGGKINVCKKMFLSTLGLKSDGMVTEFKKATIGNRGLTCTIDHRGKHAPKNKIDYNAQVIEHIESYKPHLSHYTVANAPNRRYLDMNISIKHMWIDFKEKHNKTISYTAYRRIFEAQNIGYSRPSSDECPTCILRKNHDHKPNAESTATTNTQVIDSDDGGDHNNNNNTTMAADACVVCRDMDLHLHLARDAREEYENDASKQWTGGERVFAVDMQKVLLLPKMNIKEHFFISRLTVFNETFASMSSKQDLCVMWHEALSGRDASDVASAYYEAMNKVTDATKFVFWADNCCAQNKNWTLFSAFITIVNSLHGPDEICMKYFEPGHTYMRADAVHGAIGKKMMKQEQILDWNDLCTLVNNASKTTEVVELLDFYEFPDNHRQSSKKNPLPLLKDVRVAVFSKGSTSMKYKSEMKDVNFSSVEFIKVKMRKEQLQNAWRVQKKKERGMLTEKKENIILKLTPYMPPRKTQFWHSLPTTDAAPDLVSTRDPTEISS